MTDGPGGGAPHERRKTVTILFCDVVGSTSLGESLDPEALRSILARYFDRMRAIVERHGGTVEKFIGDAVVAVFGVPVAHEDDALRAARAALEMRAAAPEVGVEARIGVNTGEVVTGTTERLVAGDAVNVAARFEQAAPPGEVLIGASTFALVRDAADVEPVEPLALKGKTEPVPAYRLLAVRDVERPGGRLPFVGRRRETAALVDAWRRARDEGRASLVTVVGEPGVGKSRLVAESIPSFGATVVRGRCPQYGDGVTYLPVLDVLRQLPSLPSDERAATTMRSLLGEGDERTSADEIAWAFRKTLEHAGGGAGLVVVFDDIQWGQDTFLDLVEQVVLLSSAAPILLLCMARPELLDRRPEWPVGLRLEPLADADVDQLVPADVPDDRRRAIARAAGGNPLFVEEMVAMDRGGDGVAAVPPTLWALLAARLDGLDTAERVALERGSIEGEVFHLGALQALDPEDPRLMAHLAALVRTGLIVPERAPGEDAFRFRHLLIRDAAYEGLTKSDRAELHRRLASWFEQGGGDRVELDEIVGFQLERSVGYERELGRPADPATAAAAKAHLSAAGRRAHRRGDYRAAAGLFDRALALAAPDELDVSLETARNDALYWAGEGNEGIRRASAAAARAGAADDRAAELCFRLEESIFRMTVEPESLTASVNDLAREAIPLFEAAGDDVGLYVAYHALGDAAFELDRTDTSRDAYDRAAEYAERAGEPHAFLNWRATARYYGSTTVAEMLAWLDEREAEDFDHWLRAYRALSLAMLGRFDEGRAIFTQTREDLAQRGGGIRLGVLTGIELVDFELLAGDAEAAARAGTEGIAMLEELDDAGFLSTATATVARAMFAVGRDDEADALTRRADELGSPEDAATQMRWRQVRAKMLARRREHEDAERLAREAVAIAAETDDLNGQADADADLGEVLALAGRMDEAAEAFERAAARYERKGNAVMASRTADRLVAMDGGRGATEK